MPAINGKAPQIPHPVKPKIKSLKDSDFELFFLFLIFHQKKMALNKKNCKPSPKC